MEIVRLKEIGVAKAAKKAAEALARGGIIIYPTDTIYGIGVDARNQSAVRRLKELKGRETKKPISIMVGSVEEMARYGQMNAHALSFAHAHLPGPLTLVVRGNPMLPLDVQLHDTIGLRVPNDEFCNALSRAFDGPITSTSANKSGLAAQFSVQDIIWQFGSHIASVALIIDAGELPHRPASTVVSCLNDTPYVLREGALSREALGL